MIFLELHVHHHPPFLNSGGRWGTTDDFTTSYLHFSLFSNALLDLANSRPVPSLMLSSQHLFSFSVCFVFFPVSLCLARWFWSDLMNGRDVHTTSVCVSLRWSGGLRVVRLPVGSWHRLPRWQHGLCMRCIVSCGSIAFHLTAPHTMACILLRSFAVRVHDSQVYRKMDVTRQHIIVSWN